MLRNILIIHVAELHIQRMLAQEGARVQRYLDVGRMWQRTSHSHQLPLAVFLARNMAGYMDHFVGSAFDINASATARQSALESKEKVAVFHRFAITVGHSLQQLRGTVMAAVQCLPQLFVIALVAVVPDRLAHHIDL